LRVILQSPNLGLMRLPLNPSVVQYLIEQKYEYWLAKTDGITAENASQITLIPVHKDDCTNLPAGYSYFKIGDEIPKTKAEETDVEIIVNLINDDILNYKKFLLRTGIPDHTLHRVK
jgi:hypothetical protein